VGLVQWSPLPGVHSDKLHLVEMVLAQMKQHPAVNIELLYRNLGPWCYELNVQHQANKAGLTIEVPNKDGSCRLDCLDITGSLMLLVWLASTSEPDKLECICEYQE